MNESTVLTEAQRQQKAVIEKEKVVLLMSLSNK